MHVVVSRHPSLSYHHVTAMMESTRYDWNLKVNLFGEKVQEGYVVAQCARNGAMYEEQCMLLLEDIHHYLTILSWL